MVAILNRVLRRIKPTSSDMQRLERVVTQVMNKVRRVARSRKVKTEPMLVGSAARGTWLRSERELDIFLLFDPEMPRAELERQGLAIAREVAGPSGREHYAEHPYVRMEFEGFQVDLVPCYRIDDPRKLKSAVDRTPHHQRYVQQRLTPQLADQVLLTKQFLRGIGVYGAEARIQGFSGYLSELLVIHYGSFQQLVENAARWKPGIVIDIERVYPSEAEPRVLFERQPLVVVDPVDPKRNVAAAVSMRSFAIFVLACREFLKEPREQFFFPNPPPSLTQASLLNQLKRRGTTLCCLWFRHNDLPEDVIYPQLRKTERSISNEVVQAGFEILRSDVWADSRNAAVLVELSISRLPPIQIRPGPQIPVDATDFLREYSGSRRRLAGPYVDEAGRVVCEVRRVETDGVRCLKRVISEHRGFGKHVAESIEAGRYRLLVGREITKAMRNRSFREFLADYLDKRLPWYR